MCHPRLHELSVTGEGKALLRVGPGGASRRAFILTLHGTGESPRDALWAFRGANHEPVVLLAPARATMAGACSRRARAGTSPGSTARSEAFARCRIDPGGISTEARTGSPRIFVAHGTRDRRIPIEDGAGQIVPRLRAAGYEVEVWRFDGRHEVPRSISEAAISWFLER